MVRVGAGPPVPDRVQRRPYEASVAFGTDPAQARVAADRTTTFYTGTPEPGAGANQV